VQHEVWSSLEIGKVLAQSNDSCLASIVVYRSGKMAEMLIISQLTINFISYLHGAEKEK